MTKKKSDNAKEPDNNDNTVFDVHDIAPLTEEELYNGILYNFSNGAFGDSDKQIEAVFKKHFGENYQQVHFSGKRNGKKLLSMSQEILEQKLGEIKLKSTSLVDDNINGAMANILTILALNIDAAHTSLDVCKEVMKQRSEYLEELHNTCEVLWLGRRLYDWYSTGVVSPEINSDILKMQDLYRNGVIDREVLAMYYYNVALAYEKYTSQKNNQQAITSEHSRSIKYMKKALNKTDTNISLVMTIKDYLSDESNYDPQLVLDACHRIMDNNDDNRSLYLAHKLYAETLAESRKIKGFSSNNNIGKVIEHYRTALSYGSSKEDKLDILEAMAEHQRKADEKGYIRTQLEITELLSGRKRIRALKNLINQVDSQTIKIGLLKSAINEFVDLEDIRREDLPLYKSLDTKLRTLAADDPKTIKKLDVLQKKFLPNALPQTQDLVLIQMSSKGNDVFSK